MSSNAKGTRRFAKRVRRLPSALTLPLIPRQLDRALQQLDLDVLPADRRAALLARAFELRSGRQKPGGFWKIDLDAIDLSAVHVEPPHRCEIDAPVARGLIACDLVTAATTHAQAFTRAFGSAIDLENDKFAALAAALCNTGAFVHVSAGVSVDDPIEITYEAKRGTFPYTLVMLERGARCTVIERIKGESDAFVCGVSEIVTAQSASVTYAAEQQLPLDARAFFTRDAVTGNDSSVTFSVADLGAALAVTGINARINHPGAQVEINALFFPRGNQHVDMVSTVDHNAGDSQSQTLVKSAATGRGQARYLGNIRIAPHAQATQAALRDDALLLSKAAHIDSVPALEIAANNVKAYHGATVGALDDEQIFYMTSRGIAREDAEKMIALGFFAPVVDRFPTNALRERLRESLEAKISA